jgi:hypothetical protein
MPIIFPELSYSLESKQVKKPQPAITKSEPRSKEIIILNVIFLSLNRFPGKNLQPSAMLIATK